MRSRRILQSLFFAFAAACSADHIPAPGILVLADVGNGTWRTVSTGAAHSCALDFQGRAYCWGSNSDHQLGVDVAGSTCGAPDHEVDCSLVPIPIASGRTFQSISAGGTHTCAISTDSVPYCWGSNARGQLGTSDFGSAEPRIPGTLPMLSISAGTAHTCGIRTDNLLMCWGSNALGAVGVGAGNVLPTQIGGNQRFASVDASDHRTCARTNTGRVMCWGAMWVRVSGDTNFSSIRTTPAFVSGLGAMRDIGLGPNSSCGVDATGFAWCWETNIHGERGTGPGAGSLTPRRVASDQQFTSISVGLAHACALTVDGAAWCWGSNHNGQLGGLSHEVCGAGMSACSTWPVAVVGTQRFISLSAGLGYHVCGVTDRFNLYCWGAGEFGQRGDGTTVASSGVPRLAVRIRGQ